MDCLSILIKMFQPLRNEVCITVPSRDPETYTHSINTETHLIYTYKNLTRMATIMNYVSGNACNTVDENFAEYVAKFRDITHTRRTFLDNFEDIVTRYIQSKFPNIQALFVSKTSKPIVDDFPMHVWVTNGATFFVYDDTKLAEIVSRAFALMVLSKYKSGEMQLAQYNQLSIQSKFNLETERTINRLSEKVDFQCTKAVTLRRFLTDKHRPEPASFAENDETQLQLNIATIWEPENSVALGMLIILTEIIETPLICIFEHFIDNLSIQKPTIEINFAQQKAKEVSFLPSRLSNVSTA